MKKIVPDDYYNNGIFEIARIGKEIIAKNNVSPAQHRQLKKDLKCNYRNIINDINEKVRVIRDKVLLCDPIQLLSFSSDMGLLSFINLFSEFQMQSGSMPIARATEYIQSIYVSSPKNETIDRKQDPTLIFNEILKDIEELYELINYFYLHWGAILEDFYPNENMEMINHIVEEQMLYLVRGQRYQVFENEYFEKLLYIHNDILINLFGISSDEVIKGIKNLQYSLTQGKLDAIDQFKLIMDQLENCDDTKETFFENYKDESQDFYDKFFGTQLRNVIKVTGWPEKFVNELSWEQNSVPEFFNQSDYSGWPIIDLPIFKRPFIKIDGVSYCFDYYSFMDNFYRVLQKTITRIDPSYKWSKYQQISSETMVEDIFKSILPSCLTYTSNYYPVNDSLKELAENDLIVVYDDTLIIVEVKAGSFVYTAPINDFEAHIKSYKNLIEKADWQCRRTEDYLKKNDVAKLYDSKHKLKASIDMKKISSVYSMSVTIDNINSFAAKAEKIKFLELQSNAISIAIDDLMVYREYFQSPLLFLHFLQQRSLATQNPKLALNDELDHLGMYIKHNCYNFQTELLPKNTTRNFIGYREELDDYFCKLYQPKLNPIKPIQDLPWVILEIINYLETNLIENRSYIANYFLNFSTEAKQQFCQNIEYVLKRQQEIKSVVPFHSNGTGDFLRYTCFINQSGIVETDKDYKRKYALACLSWNNDSDRFLVELDFDKNKKLQRVSLQNLEKCDINEDEKKEIEELGAQIASFRFNDYRKNHKGKIGRNQLCPCGSGKKYKKCCGKLY